MDLDSFFEGDNGIEDVLELSTKISLTSTLELFESYSLISRIRFFVIVFLVRVSSKTDLNKFLF